MKTKNLQLLLTRLENQLDSPEAARFNMNHFGTRATAYTAGVLEKFPPVCKTQACLGGETVLATGSGRILEGGGIEIDQAGYSSAEAIKDRAQKDLGLTNVQALRLFFFKRWTASNNGWPEKFQQMYENAKTPQGRLYAAIRRVEHFIATKGRE